MSDGTPCPTCGSPVPAGSPGGACPRCLLAAGLESGGAGGPAAPPTPAEMGRNFPSLEVLEVLGQGGMGIVYKARHRNLDRLVALKVLPPEAAREAGFAERFTREARTLARLHHPHIVGVHDFGETGGLYYLVMEYVDGPNLRQVIRDGKLEPRQALAIVPQVCDALQYAHDQGVVHRDIKPENILLDREGRVRIADFGLAKIVQRAPMDMTITRAGQVMGTLQYMAPEQYRAPDSVDHRADIYSLGVVFYEMLTGEVPTGVFPPPSRTAGVDARLDGVVLRALEKERERRWQHASDVRTEVDSIAAGPAPPGAAPPPPTRVAPSPPPPPLPPEPKLHWPAVAGGLAFPAALLAGTIMGLFVRLLASPPTAHGWATGTFFLVGLAGWITAIVAWAQIHHSGGRLAGKSWAMVGTIATPFLLCCPGSLLMPGVSDSFDGINIGKHGIRMPGITIEDGPGGRTKVRVPGVTVEEGPDGTRVQVPGITIEEKEDARAKVRNASLLVRGGPMRWTDGDRAAVYRGIADLWEASGAEFVRDAFQMDPSRAAAYWIHLAHFSENGRDGRVVMTDGVDTVACAVFLDGSEWRFQARGRVHESGVPGTEWDNPKYGGRRPPEHGGKGTPAPDAGGGRPTPPIDLSGTPVPPDSASIAADACLVHGGPKGRSASDLADVARAIRKLWGLEGPRIREQEMNVPEKVGDESSEFTEFPSFPGDPADFRLHAVALAEEGYTGRAVFSDSKWTFSIGIKAGLGAWGFVENSWEWRTSPPTKEDEDGRLYETVTTQKAITDSASSDLHAACLVHGGGRMGGAERATVVQAIRGLWDDKGPEFVRKPVKVRIGDAEVPWTPGGPAANFNLFAVALEEDGRAGRAVLTNRDSTISIRVERDGDRWVMVETDWEQRTGRPVKEYEDGWLYR